MSSFKNQKSFYWVRPDALNPNAIPKHCNAMQMIKGSNCSPWDRLG